MEVSDIGFNCRRAESDRSSALADGEVVVWIVGADVTSWPRPPGRETPGLGYRR
jgi:hypothetical protein